MKRFIAKVSKFYKGGEKGFTLIELLIVIVILGVLAAAIIPNLSKFVGSGNVGAANAELASVRTAVSAYQSEAHAAGGPGNVAATDAGILPTAATSTAAQVVGGAGIVVNAAVEAYMQGTVKGMYQLDATGLVIKAANGTGGWPTTIVFSGTVANGFKWVSGTGAATTFAPP
jgi:type IV pilus assembly protein PilA